MTTPLNSIAELAGSTLNFTTLNRILRHYEQLASLSVKGAANSPPSSPADGDAYLIGGSGSGLFAGKTGQIAFSVSGAWYFLIPSPGLRLYREDNNLTLIYEGSFWQNDENSTATATGLTSNSTLTYAGVLLVDSAAALTHTLSDPFKASTCLVINTGNNAFTISASGTTYLIGVGQSSVFYWNGTAYSKTTII